MLRGHKRKNKSCLLVYIPWESCAALGFRLVPSEAEVCWAPRQAAAPLGGQNVGAAAERAPRTARGDGAGRETAEGSSAGKDTGLGQHRVLGGMQCHLCGCFMPSGFGGIFRTPPSLISYLDL